MIFWHKGHYIKNKDEGQPKNCNCQLELLHKLNKSGIEMFFFPTPLKLADLQINYNAIFLAVQPIDCCNRLQLSILRPGNPRLLPCHRWNLL